MDNMSIFLFTVHYQEELPVKLRNSMKSLVDIKTMKIIVFFGVILEYLNPLKKNNKGS